MEDKGTERRLAAVLALDVVGFSAMMNRDEMGTLRRVQALQNEIIGPLTELHRGRVFKLIGDGVLADFKSVHDAFACSVAILNKLDVSELNLQVRCGLHIGDLIFEGDDVFGDGVNIAARLEGVAKPGSIAISERAWTDLGKAHSGFVDLGRIALKNIKEPVRVFLFHPSLVQEKWGFRPLIRHVRGPLIILAVLSALAGASKLAWTYFYRSPERVAEEALLQIPCSWLGVRRVGNINGVPIVEVEGGALLDAVDVRRKLLVDVSKFSKVSAEISVENVGKLPKPFCDFAERFRTLRYDGPTRWFLKSMHPVADAAPPEATDVPGFRVRIKVYPQSFGKRATVFGVEPDGKIRDLGLLRDILQHSPPVGVTNQDEFTVITEGSGVLALLVIDSKNPVPSDIVRNGSLDVEDLGRLRQAADQGKWNIEMLWFDHSKPDPNSGVVGTDT